MKVPLGIINVVSLVNICGSEHRMLCKQLMCVMWTCVTDTVEWAWATHTHTRTHTHTHAHTHTHTHTHTRTHNAHTLLRWESKKPGVRWCVKSACRCVCFQTVAVPHQHLLSQESMHITASYSVKSTCSCSGLQWTCTHTHTRTQTLWPLAAADAEITSEICEHKGQRSMTYMQVR